MIQVHSLQDTKMTCFTFFNVSFILTVLNFNLSGNVSFSPSYFLCSQSFSLRQLHCTPVFPMWPQSEINTPWSIDDREYSPLNLTKKDWRRREEWGEGTGRMEAEMDVLPWKKEEKMRRRVWHLCETVTDANEPYIHAPNSVCFTFWI